MEEKSLPSLTTVSGRWWDAVYSKLDKAAVFIDAGAAECLHWNGGGVLKLFSCGAVTVKDFSSFEVAAPNQEKAVFLLTKPLWRVTLNILRDIISNSKLKSCIIITSVSPFVHNLAKCGHWDPNNVAVNYVSLKEQLLTWMGNKNYMAEIHVLPIFISPLCPTLFLTPGFASLFPPLQSNTELLQDLFNEQRTKGSRRSGTILSDLDFSVLPLELQVQVQHFVTSFNAILDALNVREDCFSLGHFSRLISSELEQLPAAKTRRKNATNRLSLIFVDRTLDLAQATSYEFDTLLDKIMYLLPKMPSHVTDVAVDMSPLCSDNIYRSGDASIVVPGCLAHSNEPVAATILNAMIMSKPKECILEINRHLVDAVSKEGLNDESGSKLGRVTSEALLLQVKKFKHGLTTIENHCGLLQHSLATVQALQHSECSKIETLLAIEKALMQLLSEKDSASALRRIAQIIAERKIRNLSIEESLVLLVRLCTLRGKDFFESAGELSDVLKAVLGDALLQDYDKLPDYLKNAIGSQADELTVHDMVAKLFNCLSSLCNSRADLKKYRSIYDEGNAAEPASYRPIMKQLIKDVYGLSTNVDLVDLECRSSGLKDMLKSGLGLFMNVSKPRPSDNPTVIIFIVGGTTTTEVRQIRDAILECKPKMQVIVGSTKIALPKETLNLLVADNEWKFY